MDALIVYASGCNSSRGEPARSFNVDIDIDFAIASATNAQECTSQASLEQQQQRDFHSKWRRIRSEYCRRFKLVDTSISINIFQARRTGRRRDRADC